MRQSHLYLTLSLGVFLALAEGCVSHPGSPRTLTASDCGSCHSDKMATAEITHTTAQDNCKSCHGLKDWSEVAYTHDPALTLTGAHSDLACTACHTQSFADTGSTCQSCHTDTYTQTREPAHTEAGLPLDCALCHTQNDWSGATYNHRDLALVGEHTSIIESSACTQCHTNNFRDPIDETCWTCHAPNYASTRNPDHAAGGYPNDCAVCHTQDDWDGIRFSHTNFSMSGAHLAVVTNSPCNVCHTSGYDQTINGSDCYACHADTVAGVGSPDHSAYSHNCAVCHTQSQWDGATFVHENFSMSGAHLPPVANGQCNACHTSGDYSIPINSGNCVACHQSDYDGTSDPNHTTLGFSTNCSSCHHSQSVWTGATYSHTNFVVTDDHSGFSCAQCHTGPAATNVTCIACHTHSAAATASHHSPGDVPNYAYVTSRCLDCHRTGEATNN